MVTSFSSVNLLLVDFTAAIISERLAFANGSGIGCILKLTLAMSDSQFRLRGGAVNAGEAFSRHGAAALDHLTGDDELFDALLRRQGVHGIKQQLFENHHQAARAYFSVYRLASDSLQRVFGELQLDVIEVKFLLVLLNECILWLSENLDQRAL